MRQVIMELPILRTLSFTGEDQLENNKFAFIASDSSTGHNVVHCFSSTIPV